MSKSLLCVLVALLFITAGCATNKPTLDRAMYKLELVQASQNTVSISIVPTSTIEFDNKTSAPFKNIWLSQAKIACRGKFKGEPTEQIYLSSSDGVKVTTTTLPNGETKTERTRVSTGSATLTKVSGIATCKKALAGL
jgi:hypothetical protein